MNPPVAPGLAYTERVTDSDQRNRKAILRRRERFVATALASAGLAVATNSCNPSWKVCRTIRRGLPSISDTVGCGHAGPCLSIAYVGPDTGAPPTGGPDASETNDAGDAASGDADASDADDGS